MGNIYHIKNKIKIVLLGILSYLVFYSLPYVLWAYQDYIYEITKTSAELRSIFTALFPVLQALGIVLGVIVFFKLGFYKESFTIFLKKNLFILGIYLLSMFVAAYITINIYNLYFSEIPIANTAVLSELTNNMPFISRYFLLPLSAGVFEEAIFRGCVYRLFDNEWIAFVVSVLSFTYLHTQFTWSFWVYLPGAVIITMSYHRRKVLVDSMILHAVYDMLLPFVSSFF